MTRPSRLVLYALLCVATGILAAAATLGVLVGGAGRTVAFACVAVVIVVLCVATARATDSPAGFFVAVFFAVLYLVPVDYLPVSKQLASVLIDPLVVCALLAMVSPAVRWHRRSLPTVMVASLVLAGLAALLNHSGLAPRFYYASYLLTGAVVYLGVVRGSRTPADLATACRAVLVAGGVASVYGIVEYVLRRNPIYGHYYPSAGPGADGARYFPGTVGYRITTSIGQPLAVAGFLVAALVISIGVQLASHSPRERRFAAIVGVLCFVALMMTQSRAAVVIGPCAVLAVLIALHRRPGAQRLAILVVVGLAIGLPATSGIWLHRFTSSTTQASTEARVLGLHYIESAAPKAIPFGLGFGASQARLFAGGVTISGASAEDGWSELFIDGGPFVALTLLALPLTGVLLAVRRRGTDPLRVAVAVATLALVVDAFTFNGILVIRTFLILLMGLAAMSLPNGDAQRIAR
jgi:hypothetical protein